MTYFLTAQIPSLVPFNQFNVNLLLERYQKSVFWFDASVSGLKKQLLELARQPVVVFVLLLRGSATACRCQSQVKCIMIFMIRNLSTSQHPYTRRQWQILILCRCSLLAHD